MSEPKTVLVIEDDLDLQNLMASLLELDGYRVERASHGLEGLAIIARHLPDLILLDMRMPVMDGWRFAQEFRERYDRLRPIVVVTAAADARERAAEIQADGYIAKPFDLDELIQVVASFTPNGVAQGK
jgi:CheY-like chemotaxis protein